MLETDLFLTFSALYNFTAQILTMVIDSWGRHLAVWAQCPSCLCIYPVSYAVH